MCWRNVIAEVALDTGPVHDAGAISTRSASGSEKAPLVRCPGSETETVASAAVEITVAEVVAVYSLSSPGVNEPKLAGAPSERLSVAGTVPPTVPFAMFVALKRHSCVVLPLAVTLNGGSAGPAFCGSLPWLKPKSL